MQISPYVSEMVGIEEQVLALLSDRAGDVEVHPRAASALGRFQQMVQENVTSLRGRLSTLPAGEPSQPTLFLPVPTRREPADATHGQVVRALHTWHTALSHVAVCYAILHAVAHRLYDGEGEGNTADLAEAHLRRYTGAAKRSSS